MIDRNKILEQAQLVKKKISRLIQEPIGAVVPFSQSESSFSCQKNVQPDHSELSQYKVIDGLPKRYLPQIKSLEFQLAKNNASGKKFSSRKIITNNIQSSLSRLSQLNYEAYAIKVRKGWRRNPFSELLLFIKTIFVLLQQESIAILEKTQNTKPDQFQIILAVNDRIPQTIFCQFNKISGLLECFVIQKLKENWRREQLIEISVQQLECTLTKLSNEISKYEFQPHKILQEVIIALKNQDILIKSRMFKEVKNKMLQIIKNVEVYGVEIAELLIEIKNILQHKLFKHDQFYTVYYEDMMLIIQEINSKLKLQSIGAKFDRVSSLLRSHSSYAQRQKLKIYFLQKLSQLNKIQFKEDKGSFQSILKVYFNFLIANPQHVASQSLVIKAEGDTIRLGEYFSMINQLNAASCYLDEIERIQYCSRYSGGAINSKQVIRMSQAASFFARIETQSIATASCLACSTFFYYRHNVYDQSVSIIPAYSFQSAENLEQAEFLSVISAFLNCGGGVVLLEVKKKFKRLIVQGKFFNEADKFNTKQRLINMVTQKIYPPIEIQRVLKIDFVPVATTSSEQLVNKYEQAYDKSQKLIYDQKQFHLLNYMRDIYVIRIRVCPQNSSTVYFVKENLTLKCFTLQKGKAKEINNTEMIKMLRKKMANFLERQQISEGFGIVAKINQNLFQHTCKPIIEVRQRSENPRIKDNSKEGQFRQMCLLIVRQRDISFIQQKLRIKGYNYAVQLKFSQYKFKSAKHCALLYIDLSFGDILKDISFNQQFYVNGRALLILRIQQRLKLQRRSQSISYQREEFIAMNEWFKKQFPQQLLCLYEYRYNNTKEYYFQTQTKAGCLFLYYLLNNFEEKCSFKEPKDLQRFSSQQRQQNWILIYQNHDFG